MGICEVLLVIFVLLKIFGITAVATWSWWLVLTPLWVGILLNTISILIIHRINKNFDKKRRY